MNAERLLAHFEQISEAPDATTQLRRFILDLAVRAKLVDQDPEEEPVKVLLTEIQSRIRSLGLKSNFSRLDASEMPFPLPRSWVWRRLGELCEKTGSGSTPRGGKDAYAPDGIPFLRSQNIYNDGLRLNEVVFIDEKTHHRMAGTQVMPADLLLNITGGSIGRCAKVPLDFNEANVSQHVAIIRPAARGMEDFIHVLILSPYFQAFIDKSQTGAGRGGLPKNRMDAIPVPLPPLAEQHRIVARLNELMALCDQLEAAREQREQYRQRLITASLQRLNQPAEDLGSFRRDASFALQTLPTIFTNPAQIKQLRKTILNLAVQGKLVAQDPEDDPAEGLRNIFTAEKARLAKMGEIKKNKPLAEVDLENYPCIQGWVWDRLGNLSTMITKGSTPTTYGHAYTNEGVNFVKVESIKDGLLTPFGIKSFISPETNSFLSRSRLESGDLLFSIAGSIGTCAVVEESILPANTNQALAIIRGTQMVFNPHFLLAALRSTYAQSILTKARGVAMNNVSLHDVQNLVVPLPPLEEQNRIVAKVEELMALCDQLEKQLNQAEQSRRGLLEAVLQEALADKGGPDASLIATA